MFTCVNMCICHDLDEHNSQPVIQKGRYFLSAEKCIIIAFLAVLRHFYEPDCIYKQAEQVKICIIFPSNTGPTILICNHFQTFHLCLFSVVDFHE